MEGKINSIEMAIRQFLPTDVEIFKEEAPELPDAQKQLTEQEKTDVEEETIIWIKTGHLLP